jgi:hypothetical protein
MASRNQLAMIHILKKDLGLSDPEYRDILFKTAGVKSAADLKSNQQTDAVISALNRKNGKIDFSKIRIRPRAERNSEFVQFKISKPHAPWTYCDACDENWSKFGDIIDEAAKRHITVVACEDGNGRRYFKYRPMVEGRDY